ncbi:DNA polymerase I, partial [Corynebacterium sp. KPL2850]
MQKKNAPAVHEDDQTLEAKDTIMASDGQVSSIDPDHLAELHASAISDDVIRASGIYTAYTRDELPEPLRWIAKKDGTMPALVFPMEEAGRGTTHQVKPQPESPAVKKGRIPKYVCPKKGKGFITPSFIEQRPITDDTRRVLIVEGTKQALAALSWADDETAVYGIPGIQTWKGGKDGPSPAFTQLKGHSVYIIPDADAGSNRAVYDGAQALGEHCKAWGASPVRFVSMPGHGSQGLDDVLATVGDDERSEMLELWIRQAQGKPARKMPKRASKKQRSNTNETRNDSRPTLYTDLPPETLWDRAWEAIESKHAGVTLFRQDSRPVMISRRDGQAVLVPVDRATGRRLAAAAFDLVRETDNSTTVVAPVDKDIDVIFSPVYTDSLPPLHSVTRSPLVTETGEIITRSGYHKGTGVYVDLDDSLTGISVPDKPSDQDVENAKVLLEDVLYDFPWVTPADRTRALGALLTPLARPMLTTAPMHVISAVRRSSGKGLLTDVFHLIATGETAAVQDLPGTETEMRKVIASKLFAGAATLFLDECSSGVDSKALSALLTAESYTDRILGESRMISVHNNLCVYAAGNNIAVDGDLARRVVPILLDPKCSRPESRSGFRHPHLRRYVRDHRRELLAAALTLIRAWAVAGRPSPRVAGPFGSFEGWYHVVGGTLEHVGYTDLTVDLEEIRARYNASEQENAEHLAWLYEEMGDGDFRAFDAECRIADSRDYVPLPEGLVSLDEVSARRLGRVYSRLQGAWIGGYCLESAGVKHHTKLFRVVREDDQGHGQGPDNGTSPEPPAPAPSGVGNVGPNDGGTTAPAPEQVEPAEPTTPAVTDTTTTVVFDLETGSADDLHVTDDPGFVRLATYSVKGPNPGKWTRGFNQDAIVSVADPAAS